MFVVYGLMGMLYLVINIIITITWLSDNDYRKQWIPVIAIILLLFGLPILIVVFVTLTIGTIIELVRGEHD